MLQTVMQITDKQINLLSYLESYINRAGYAPNTAEMRQALPGENIQYHLIILEAAGYIERKKGDPRLTKVIKTPELT